MLAYFDLSSVSLVSFLHSKGFSPSSNILTSMTLDSPVKLARIVITAVSHMGGVLHISWTITGKRSHRQVIKYANNLVCGKLSSALYNIHTLELNFAKFLNFHHLRAQYPPSNPKCIRPLCILPSATTKITKISNLHQFDYLTYYSGIWQSYKHNPVYSWYIYNSLLQTYHKQCCLHGG